MVIKEDYVSFEIAKLLKEKGFNEPCWCYWNFSQEEYPTFLQYRHRNSDDDLEEKPTAPTFQMAMKWLREVHKIFIEISVSIDFNGKYHYSYFILNRECKYIRKGYADFDWNYEQACEAAIKYCLENIID